MKIEASAGLKCAICLMSVPIITPFPGWFSSVTSASTVPASKCYIVPKSGHSQDESWDIVKPR